MTDKALSPPRPAPDELTSFFWEGCREDRLLILRCSSCGFHIHWPRPVCPRCLCEELAPAEMSGDATLYAYTITQQAFHPYFADKLPLIVASVELVEQPDLKLVTNIVDCSEDDLRTGMALHVEFHAVDDELTLPLFVPSGGPHAEGAPEQTEQHTAQEAEQQGAPR
jgi:uncharacterized OB-fold protein